MEAIVFVRKYVSLSGSKMGQSFDKTWSSRLERGGEMRERESKIDIREKALENWIHYHALQSG